MIFFIYNSIIRKGQIKAIRKQSTNRIAELI